MTIASNINSHTQSTGWTSGQQRSPDYQSSSSKRGSSSKPKSTSPSTRSKTTPKGNVYSSFANQSTQGNEAQQKPDAESCEKIWDIPHPEPHQGQIPQPFPEADYYRVQTSPLRGANYYLDQEQLESLQVGQALQLHAEPANPYDKYAVRVHRGELHLGYLPRQSNHIVSRLLRQGAPLSARIAWVATDLENNPPITLDVMLEKLPDSKISSINPKLAEPDSPIRVTVS